ncbi:MAG: threonylcarbamoyl-AMP synthase [Chloroflexi bacterium]|nr:MAG: threonylcarbamoyl-AMP synthase [Chloroflexota bacterium]
MPNRIGLSSYNYKINHGERREFSLNLFPAPSAVKSCLKEALENRLENCSRTAVRQTYNTRHFLTSDPHAIAETAVCLSQGELVVFPTDTVYGVGVDAFKADAILKLYTVKQRPLDKGIPILLADLDDINKVAVNIPLAAQAAIHAFWPGPLTIIVPKHPDLPACISPNAGIALRIPNHEAARALIRAAGGALATSSANLSGHQPACDGLTALTALQGRVAAVLDGGATPGNTPSTIVNFLKTEQPVLREGPISVEQLRQSGVDSL